MANILSPTETWDPTASHQGQALEYGRKLDPHQVRLKSRCQRSSEPGYLTVHDSPGPRGVIHSEVSRPEDHGSHAQ